MSKSPKKQGVSSALHAVLPLLPSLQIEERILVLERLVGRHSDSDVVMTPQPIPLLDQIEQMNREQLGEVLLAVSERIARGG